MIIPQNKIFYTTDAVLSGFKFNPGQSYSVRIGFMPDTAMYVAVRTEDPMLFLEGDSLAGVRERARRALEFYLEYGLQEETEKR